MRTIRYWPRFLGRDNTMHSWQSHQSGRTPNPSFKLQPPSDFGYSKYRRRQLEMASLERKPWAAGSCISQGEPPTSACCQRVLRREHTSHHGPLAIASARKAEPPTSACCQRVLLQSKYAVALSSMRCASFSANSITSTTTSG